MVQPAIVTKDEIGAAVARLGVAPGARVVVHSSLGSFGDVQGGADAVLSALFEAVGPAGTIVMPGYLVGPPLALYPPDRWLIGCRGAWGDFLVVQQEAEARGMVRSTTAGAATIWLFHAAPVVDLYERLLREDPYRMFGLEGPERSTP